jgi:predicted SAM-dependent methyltransferase/predicted 2-oxoglutarate/Fe(II)-dependent dioxygenase YbiX
MVAAEVLMMQLDPQFPTTRNPVHAPVLHLTDLLDRSLCERLMQAHAQESSPGTTMQFREGRYAPVVDLGSKNRRDHRLAGDLLQQVWMLLCARAWPAVLEAFAFEITRFEYIHVGCYCSDEGGHFAPHRDNSTPNTAHRRFALSVNLNDDYEGGELHFPECHRAVYRPAAGSGVVFSCSLMHAAAPVTRGKRYVLVAMLGGDADLAIYEAARGLRRRATPGRLAGDARRLRQIAGDVAAFGDRLHPAAAARLDRVHDELMHLENDLRAERAHLLEQQAPLPQASEIKLHLGCGAHRLSGWVNVDACGGDIRMDLRWPLPFRDQSVRYVFACHVVEHLYRGSELPGLLAEILRVLMPGGVLRLVVPDIEQCLRAYVAGDDRFFADRAQTWPWAAACKTRLDHFLNYAGAGQALEDLGGHKYGYDFDTLALALHEAGFGTVERSAFMASRHPELRVDDASHNAIANTDGRYYSLFVEASQ